jgi:tetrahydromethanopterin S-methyltransferase subunit A
VEAEIKEQRASALHVVAEQIKEAIEAPKCHPCGCLHNTVEALGSTTTGQAELAPVLSQARAVFQTKQYDCLGCPVCYPAIAANAFSAAFPGSALNLCPTEEAEERVGWPPLPGNYHVLRYRAAVAVCTLNSEALASSIRDRKPQGLAIIGTLRTENLGIERIIRNILANPNVRVLILCGEDTQQAVGHLPGQSLESLFHNGVDDRGRIRGARGKRPVLKNVSLEQIQAFRDQVRLVALIGEQNAEVISERVEACTHEAPGPLAGSPREVVIQPIQAVEPQGLTLDRAGYFVVYPDKTSRHLFVEHYTNGGVLDCVIEGRSAPALYTEAIKRNLVTRLDHAAYLGQELARAEPSLKTAEPYIQDRAPGELGSSPAPPACGCKSSCG